MKSYSKFHIILNSLFIVFFNVIREIINRDIVMFYVFNCLIGGMIRGDECDSSNTYTFLECLELIFSQGVCSSNYRDNVDAGGESLHEFDVHFPQTSQVREPRNEDYKWCTHACPVGGMK